MAKDRLNGLDLFSGIGGLSIALRRYVRAVCYCENDRYAQSVLLSRMAEAKIDVGPICDDVRKLSNLPMPIDIIYGGFPCQDISCAGSGAGLGGEYSGLFYEIVRLAQEIKPSFLFLENVPAIRTRGLDEILAEFTSIGYDCRWCVLSAAEIGAKHMRARWFLLAYSNQARLQKFSGQRYRTPYQNACAQSMPWPEFWEIEPAVGRVVDGLSHRVDRIKCLGNAVVPEQAKTAFEYLAGIKK